MPLATMARWARAWSSSGDPKGAWPSSRSARLKSGSRMVRSHTCRSARSDSLQFSGITRTTFTCGDAVTVTVVVDAVVHDASNPTAPAMRTRLTPRSIARRSSDCRNPLLRCLAPMGNLYRLWDSVFDFQRAFVPDVRQWLPAGQIVPVEPQAEVQP
jgi:hypothetical protein